ncbi:MAG: hypothetical protein AAF349_18030 [Cyanobacteria bacterium P01_A01_bin.68]
MVIINSAFNNTLPLHQKCFWFSSSENNKKKAQARTNASLAESAAKIHN